MKGHSPLIASAGPDNRIRQQRAKEGGKFRMMIISFDKELQVVDKEFRRVLAEVRKTGCRTAYNQRKGAQGIAARRPETVPRVMLA